MSRWKSFSFAAVSVVVALSSSLQAAGSADEDVARVPDSAKVSFLQSTLTEGERVQVTFPDGRLISGRYVEVSPMERLLIVATVTAQDRIPLDSTTGIKYWKRSKSTKEPFIVGLIAGGLLGGVVRGAMADDSFSAAERAAFISGGALVGALGVSLLARGPRAEQVQFVR